MQRCKIVKPVGLDSLCMEIEAVCEKAHVYRCGSMRPGHFIIPLDSGSGRTTVMEYITEMYKEYGVMSFKCSLDDYIEVAFDGTLAQLCQVFTAIDDAADYSIHYENIVGMDISSIASHLNEVQFKEFMTKCREVCEHACVVFFVKSAPCRNEERLMEKLCQSISNVRRITVEPYTNADLCNILIKAVGDHGIMIPEKHLRLFRTAADKMMIDSGISGVKDVIALAEKLVFFADFSVSPPVIDKLCIKEMTESRGSIVERKNVK